MVFSGRSKGSDVTLDVVHAVIFYLSKSTTLYFVYVWGDRCGREVPHFDSRPVSISDPRVGMTPLGLFGPEPDLQPLLVDQLQS
jgi:hypothetical protein